MKKFLCALGVAFAGLPAWAGPSVGVSVSVNQPGVYGRVDIGNVPQAPVVIYPQPVIISQPPVVVDRRPIYLRVPDRHSHDWRRYCGRYNACGQPVYFVREDWYQRHYHPAPRPRGDRWERDDHRGHDHGRRDRHERHDRKDRHDRHDRHDDRGHHGGRH